MSPSAASGNESIEPDRRCESAASPDGADEPNEADEAREVLEVPAVEAEVPLEEAEVPSENRGGPSRPPRAGVAVQPPRGGARPSAAIALL